MGKHRVASDYLGKKQTTKLLKDEQLKRKNAHYLGRISNEDYAGRSTSTPMNDSDFLRFYGKKQ